MDLQSLSSEAQSSSGRQLGHGVYGRQWTESHVSILTPSAESPINKHFSNSVNVVPEHPDFYPRVPGTIMHIPYVDANGNHLDLHINTHAGDNLFFATIDAVRKCLGEPCIPFSKVIFGPSAHEEEGKDFHASGYGLSCDAVANYGSVLLDGTVINKVPKGVEVFTDPLVRPAGADTVVPFSQSKAKVVLYGGTTRDGFFFDGKLRGDNLTDFQRNCFAHEVCRWDYVHQQFPDYVATKYPDPDDFQPPLTDERQNRKEFLHKARFDPEGAVLQLLRTRDALLKR